MEFTINRVILIFALFILVESHDALAQALTPEEKIAQVADVKNGSATCRCAFAASPGEDLEHSDLVFAGKFMGYDHGDLIAIFHMTLVYKGEKRDFEDYMMPIGTASSDACAYPFEPDKEYLVYAYNDRRGEGGPVTDVCTPTKLLSKASNDLRRLGPGQKPGCNAILHRCDKKS